MLIVAQCLEPPVANLHLNSILKQDPEDEYEFLLCSSIIKTLPYTLPFSYHRLKSWVDLNKWRQENTGFTSEIQWKFLNETSMYHILSFVMMSYVLISLSRLNPQSAKIPYYSSLYLLKCLAECFTKCWFSINVCWYEHN
jgi:hypothetical protein